MHHPRRSHGLEALIWQVLWQRTAAVNAASLASMSFDARLGSGNAPGSLVGFLRQQKQSLSAAR